ncbi:MAG: aminopeptidase [Xanthobacteraceae bacterium]
MTLDASPRLSHDERLDRLAEIAVRVGLRLRHGQEVVVTAPVEALPLVRRITAHAYTNGAALVTTLFSDEVSTLQRFLHAPDDSFDRAAGWLYDGMAAAFHAGAARLAVVGEDPSLLSAQDPAKVARANRARSIAYKPALDHIVNFDVNWSIVSCATPAWAKAVFPNAPPSEALSLLWEAIFSASRVDGPDPIAAWAHHDHALSARTTLLNRKRFAALRFRGPGTDLTVGLADEHQWEGGATMARNGIVCNANIPTEEVFTTPHRRRVEGTVRSTRPLSYQGTLIEDIAVRFEDGQIVESHARAGADVLAKVLSTDEGARRLGEVALVPESSPISQSGILFYNTLFDENAASHIALGQAYSKCIRGGSALSPEELAARGANSSLIHIDWMIGSAEIDVDGLQVDGTAEPLMRKGEWV